MNSFPANQHRSATYTKHVRKYIGLDIHPNFPNDHGQEEEREQDNIQHSRNRHLACNVVGQKSNAISMHNLDELL